MSVKLVILVSSKFGDEFLFCLHLMCVFIVLVKFG